MSEHTDLTRSKSGTGKTGDRTWPNWLQPRWGLLAAGLVIICMTVLQRLNVAEGLAACALLILMGLLFPRKLDGAAVPTSAPEQVLDDDTALANFADALTTPCMIINARGQLVLANQEARQDYPALVVGSALSLSLRHPTLLQSIEACLRTEEPQSAQMQQTVPTERWLEIRVAPIKSQQSPNLDSQDQPSRRFLVTLFDVSEQKRIDAMRTDFIAHASHEMRTPLTSIIGFIDTLQGPAAKDDVNRDKFLNIMRNQAERLSRLVDDMLSLSRIERHRHIYPDDDLDFKTIISEAVEGLNHRAKSLNLSLEVSLPDGPAIIKGDHREMYEVVENLIDNAFKYGAEGEQVIVRLFEEGEEPELSWRLEVRDFGPGIDPVHVPRLTERFYRVDENQSREKKGTGLGLAIVKHIVQRHRGELAIKSRLGEGTSVEVILPQSTVS